MKGAVGYRWVVLKGAVGSGSAAKAAVNCIATGSQIKSLLSIPSTQVALQTNQVRIEHCSIRLDPGYLITDCILAWLHTECTLTDSTTADCTLTAR